MLKHWLIRYCSGPFEGVADAWGKTESDARKYFRKYVRRRAQIIQVTPE